MNNGKTILKVDDDPFTAGSLEYYLAKEGFKVLVANKGRQAFDVACKQKSSLPNINPLLIGNGLFLQRITRTYGTNFFLFSC